MRNSQQLCLLQLLPPMHVRVRVLCVCIRADELKAAVLSVLQSYITSFNSTNNSSLNLLMQQQQHQSEANWAGSIAGGPAKSSKSVKPAGYAGSIVSFAGSTTSSACRAFNQAQTSAAAAPAFDGLDAAADSVDGRASGSQPSSASQSNTTARRGIVSFAGSPSPGDDSAEAAGAETAAGAPSSSSCGSTKGLLLSKAERAAGYAASIAAGSTGRGGGAGSVIGSQAARGSGGRPGSAGPTGPVSTCISLHGALVLCKEVGPSSIAGICVRVCFPMSCRIG